VDVSISVYVCASLSVCVHLSLSISVLGVVDLASDNWPKPIWGYG